MGEAKRRAKADDEELVETAIDHDALRCEIADIIARLYGDVPARELIAVAAVVLGQVIYLARENDDTISSREADVIAEKNKQLGIKSAKDAM